MDVIEYLVVFIVFFLVLLFHVILTYRNNSHETDQKKATALPSCNESVHSNFLNIKLAKC